MRNKYSKSNIPNLFNECNYPVPVGIYVCSQCSHPLFSSRSKFPHSSPWPAFTETIREDSVTKMMENLTAFKVDLKLFELTNDYLFYFYWMYIVVICRSFVESVGRGWAMSLSMMALRMESHVSEYSATRSSLSPVKVGWKGKAEQTTWKIDCFEDIGCLDTKWSSAAVFLNDF